jgi:hypothetical protein
MQERFRPDQDFKDAVERRLEGAELDFSFFWSAVQYCCCCGCRAPAAERRDSSQSLISFLLDKMIKEDDAM